MSGERPGEGYTQRLADRWVLGTSDSPEAVFHPFPRTLDRSAGRGPESLSVLAPGEALELAFGNGRQGERADAALKA